MPTRTPLFLSYMATLYHSSPQVYGHAQGYGHAQVYGHAQGYGHVPLPQCHAIYMDVSRCFGFSAFRI